MIKYYQKIIIILFSVFLIGCVSNPTEYRYEYSVIVDKNIETTEKFTNYRFAFSDLTDMVVSFGIYSNHSIGDKVYFKVIKDDGERDYWNSNIITEQEYRNNK